MPYISSHLARTMALNLTTVTWALQHAWTEEEGQGQATWMRCYTYGSYEYTTLHWNETFHST